MAANTKKSEIWAHFTLDVKNKKATCKRNPEHVLSYCGTTTNLWNHMKTKHGIETGKGKSTSTTAGARGITGYFPSVPVQTGTKKYDHDSEKQTMLTTKMRKFMAKNYEPFSLVENEHFRELVSALNPSYNIPSSKTLKKDMEIVYEQKCKEIRDIVSKPGQQICAVTTDIWTSNSKDSYISLTVSMIDEAWEMTSKCLEVKSCPGSHTADNLKGKLRELEKDWGIVESNVAVVRDSGANIKKATSEMRFRLDLGCFDHILQCAVLKALSEETAVEILKSAKKIVRHFHHSPLEIEKLKAETAKHSSDNVFYRKLKQECPTRWGSTYEMLERLIAMRKPVTNVLMDHKKTDIHDLVPLPGFWVDAAALCKTLDTLNVISKEMGAEKSCTMSSIYAIVMNLLTYVMKPDNDDPLFIQNAKTAFSEYLEERLGDDDIRVTMQAAAVLDPRMKKLLFVTDEYKKEAYKTVRTQLDRMIADKQAKQSSEASPSCPDKDVVDITETTVSASDTKEAKKREKRDKRLTALYGSTSFECYGPSKAKSAKKSNAPDMTGKKALDIYLATDAIALDKDPLTWWKENEDQHPEVSKLAKFYLGIPATSVSSERAFSTAGLIVTEKRNRLKPQTVRMLHFLNKNI